MPRRTRAWPDWWEWELDFTRHVVDRMSSRDVSEVDLRSMLHDARRLGFDEDEGTWFVDTRHERMQWRVIVSPDEKRRLLVVVTAFRCRPR